MPRRCPTLRMVTTALAESFGYYEFGIGRAPSQRVVKCIVASAVDSIAGLIEGSLQKGYRKPLMWCAPAIQKGLKRALDHTKFPRKLSQSMVDIAVYRGTEDPFEPVITAETEAYCRHKIARDSSSETSDYLWDFFKLIHVPSPVRLFVARCTGAERRDILTEKIQKMAETYGHNFYPRDAVFCVVLPTAARDMGATKCRQLWPLASTGRNDQGMPLFTS